MFRSYFRAKAANRNIEKQRQAMIAINNNFVKRDFQAVVNVVNYILGKHPSEPSGQEFERHKYLYFRDSIYLALSVAKYHLGLFDQSIHHRIQTNNRFVFAHEIGMETPFVIMLINLSVERDCLIHNSPVNLPSSFRRFDSNNVSEVLTGRRALYTNVVNAAVDLESGIIKVTGDQDIDFCTDSAIHELTAMSLDYIANRMPVDINNLKGNPLFRQYNSADLAVMDKISYA